MARPRPRASIQHRSPDRRRKSDDPEIRKTDDNRTQAGRGYDKERSSDHGSRTRGISAKEHIGKHRRCDKGADCDAEKPEELSTQVPPDDDFARVRLHASPEERECEQPTST